MERFLCIHGHFYQPPRENPWLEAVEVQDPAYPYHDWNERITAECYAPNSAARILDGEGRILDIVSNYAKISFNFGPTLLSWMETYAPSVYQAILDADARSMDLYGGHGSAIAQVYNHIIMPLASTRDKRTQIIWGIRDFEHRFRRSPEGMWLPETAVDPETLDILAEYGIRFVILAPHQAFRVRRKGTRRWKDVNGGSVDPTVPYSCKLPSGRIINIFFYDGPISRAIAFEDVLTRGEEFVGRIMAGFSDGRPWPQILSLATDGETYGHHRQFGDMALAYALNYIEMQGLAKLTNFGEYLERFGSPFEVQIIKNTSWSCFHGIERWRSNCGCNSGGHPDWNQEWRKPLRKTLDWLRNALEPLFEATTREFIKDPWMMRNDYIDLILDRSSENVANFFARHGTRPLGNEERVTILKFLEMERHALLMYTSCGWFFDELSGTETVQILSYAARAIQLAEETGRLHLENAFLRRLEQATSNLPEFADGAAVYRRLVKTSIISLKDVGVHYAISSLFQDYGTETGIYSYSVIQEGYDRIGAGAAKAAVGKVSVQSKITHESERICFSVAHLGNHFLNGGVRTFIGDGTYDSMKAEMLSAFERGDFSELARLMDKHFGMHTYSLVHLFRDQRRKVLALITGRTLEDFENRHREMYDQSKALMGLLYETGVPVPKAFLNIASLVLTANLQKAFLERDIDMTAMQDIVTTLRKFGITAWSVELELAVRRTLERMMAEFCEKPFDQGRLVLLDEIIQLIQSIRSLDVNLWQIQNDFFRIARDKYRQLISTSGPEIAEAWARLFRHVGTMLSFNIQSLLQEQEGEMHA
ncbi:MAG: Glycosyl hydrolase family 57 [Syntrophorhabdus sp. PtaU1.Bin153]|nr:MAG: Glycosyl hydrolase family 57 [Syntrophorhabdus sp. PtaU1.Bin153]